MYFVVWSKGIMRNGINFFLTQSKSREKQITNEVFLAKRERVIRNKGANSKQVNQGYKKCLLSTVIGQSPLGTKEISPLCNVAKRWVAGNQRA